MVDIGTKIVNVFASLNRWIDTVAEMKAVINVEMPH